MFERFTERARAVSSMANGEAQRFNHEYIGTEHFLLALIKEGSGVASSALKNFGLDLDTARAEVSKFVKNGPEMVTMGKLPQTPMLKRVIAYSIEESRGIGNNWVGTEHLLLGLLKELEIGRIEGGHSVPDKVFSSLNIDLNLFRESVLELLGKSARQKKEDADIGGLVGATFTVVAVDEISFLEKAKAYLVTKENYQDGIFHIGVNNATNRTNKHHLEVFGELPDERKNSIIKITAAFIAGLKTKE